MGYQDKAKDYGNPWLNDPGDEPNWTEEEEFEILRDGGMKPEDLADPEAGKRYARWLQKNPPEEEATPSA
jgi:hypothetical protein